MLRIFVLLAVPGVLLAQIRQPQPPAFLSRPTSVRTKVGQDVTLAVTVRSALPFSIAWRKDGVTVGSSERLILRSVKVTDSGVYDVVLANPDGATFSPPISVIVDPGRFGNLSVRMAVSDGGVLIAGFVVDAPKRILVRGVGRSLEQFGVPVGSSMQNPRVELYDSSGKLVAENDDYVSSDALTTATAQSGAFPFSSALDAALIVDLQIGAHTVHLRPVGGKGGDALIEIYELQ